MTYYLDPLIEKILSKIQECELETGVYCRWGKGSGKRAGEPGINPYGCADAANLLYTLGHFPTDPKARAKWVAALAESHPNFEVCSNWLYSYYMPEEPKISVAFLSGDVTYEHPLTSARWAGRIYAGLGLPWDLMAWGFKGIWGQGPTNYKSVIQLKQEAALVISLGGGFQAYYKQDRAGKVIDWPLKVLGEVGDFCRERQAICQDAVLQSDVKLYLDAEGIYDRFDQPFECWSGEENFIMGDLNALLNLRRPVSLLRDFELSGDLKEIGCIVFPEYRVLSASQKTQLLDYVKAGGRLIITGADACTLFADELGIEVQEKRENAFVCLLDKDEICNHKGDILQVKCKPGTRIDARQSKEHTPKPGDAAAVSRKYGKGRIFGVLFDVGDFYERGRNHHFEHWLKKLLEKACSPEVEIEGPGEIDVVLTTKKGKSYLHLINSGGPHNDSHWHTYAHLPAAGPFEVRWKIDTIPKQLKLQPENKDLAFKFKDGMLCFSLPPMDVMTTVEVRGLV